jgi:Kyakuja-Dileera-Zisupton transposase
MPMPNYVYDGCSTRFIAANDSNTKAEASIFEDTGLMALTCRHDRVLFMVTLKDAGERQYNALALLKALFRGLPSYWRVGVLYDIGCQVHRSMTKVEPLWPSWDFYSLLRFQHNFFPEFASRITWAVSTFHAFAHEVPCQVLYHPQKRVGFGHTDGEGCERVWASLQKLIPGTRVSGVCHSAQHSCSLGC